MLIRPTVRVLLLDRDDRLLLIKCHLREISGRPSVFWATAGGGIEVGETIEAAALRETFEETGISGLELGPVVWRDENVLTVPGEAATRFQQRYIVARCAGGALDSAGWTQQERDTILEIRWWTLAELRATADTILPPALAELLPAVLAGNFPPEPIVLEGS